MADTPFVRVERRADSVALVRLDRPKMNALSAEVLHQLESSAEDLVEDPPGAVVVWGGRRLFAAGADIAQFGGGGTDSVGPNFHRALGALSAVPRATVAAVNGYALGGGLELALACDLRVCADDARLGLPEVLLGVIPGGGGTQRLPRLIGPSRAKDLIFTGRQVGAEEALAMGLVNRVVPPDDVLDAALSWAAELARGPCWPTPWPRRRSTWVSTARSPRGWRWRRPTSRPSPAPRTRRTGWRRFSPTARARPPSPVVDGRVTPATRRRPTPRGYAKVPTCASGC